METKIVIRHRGGAGSGKTNEYSMDTFTAVTLGRDPSCDIPFDEDREDMVSRTHARITAVSGNPRTFRIADLGSRNGTYVNRQRIDGEVALSPGDVVQLGPGGPEFEFTIHPPVSKPTRLATALPAVTGTVTAAPEKAGVGKATVERMIHQSKAGNRRMQAIAAAAGLVAVALGAWYVIGKGGVGRSLTPAQIAERNTNAVVFFEVGWKIVDIQSGRQLYHVAMPNKQTDQEGQEKQLIPGAPPFLPVFIAMNGQLEPVLSTADGSGKYKAIGGSHTGSGFVVSEDGFLLTNRHVAAAWLTRYQWTDPAGVVLQLDEQANVKALQPIGGQQFPAWVPAHARILIEGDFSKENIRMLQSGISGKAIEGRNDYLDVTFARNRVRTPGKLARVSDQIDVAMCKIDMPHTLQKVEMFDNYSNIAPGEAIAILGYPAASPVVVGAVESKDVFNRQSDAKVIPDPTLSVGNIGRVIRGQTTANEATFSTFGDVYQLTVNSTGPGNSGGPVFDEKGRAIGIFTSGTRGDVMITFAVPIRYGIELMGTQRVM